VASSWSFILQECFDFLQNFVWSISAYKRNSARYSHKCTTPWRTRYSGQISMKFEFSRQIFDKSSNIKFHEYPSTGSWIVPCRGTHTGRWTDS